MDNLAIFAPINTAGGGTINYAVTSVAGDLPLMRIPIGGGTVRLCNLGSQTIFISPNGPATLATGIPLFQNAAETFTFQDGTILSCIAAGVGSTLYATLGTGA